MLGDRVGFVGVSGEVFAGHALHLKRRARVEHLFFVGYCNDYHHPVVLAREAATIDLLSDGRFELGMGAGWMTSDYERAGIPLDAARTRIDRLDEAACLAQFVGHPIHADAAEIPAIRGDAARCVRRAVPAPQIVDVIAAGAGGAESLRLAAVPERAHGRRPRCQVRRRVDDRFGASGQSLLLQRVAFTLVELPDGGFERPGQAIDFAGRRIAQAPIQQRRRDPERREERQRRRGEEREDQPIAQAVHDCARVVRASTGTDRPRLRASTRWPCGAG